MKTIMLAVVLLVCSGAFGAPQSQHDFYSAATLSFSDGPSFPGFIHARLMPLPTPAYWSLALSLNADNGWIPIPERNPDRSWKIYDVAWLKAENKVALSFPGWADLILYHPEADETLPRRPSYPEWEAFLEWLGPGESGVIRLRVPIARAWEKQVRISLLITNK
jgi:hypothetical protein